MLTKQYDIIAGIHKNLCVYVRHLCATWNLIVENQLNVHDCMHCIEDRSLSIKKMICSNES